MYLKVLAACALVASSAAYASSPGAWAAFHAKVAKSCNASSGLRQARSGEIVGFDDRLGKVVTLVTGTSPQPRQRPTTMTMLCVYDQRSSQTWTSEAKGWRSPDRK